MKRRLPSLSTVILILSALVLLMVAANHAKADEIRIASGQPIADTLSLLVDGDTVLLERGGVWTNEPLGTLTVSNVTIGAYGTGPRPVLKLGASEGLLVDRFVSNTTIDGIRFYAHTRDPNGAEFNGPEGGSGLTCVSAARGLTIRNCRFDYCGIIVQPRWRQFPDDRFAGLELIDTRIADAYPQDTQKGRAQGLFVSHTDGITLTGCTFVRNGWNETLAPPNPGSHGVYITSYCRGPVRVRNCAFLNNSASGIQARCGVVEMSGCLFESNGAQVGAFNDGADKPRVSWSGRVVNNRWTGTSRFGLYCLMVGNVADTDRCVVRGNYFAGSDFGLVLRGDWLGLHNARINGNRFESNRVSAYLVSSSDEYTPDPVFERVIVSDDDDRIDSAAKVTDRTAGFADTIRWLQPSDDPVILPEGPAASFEPGDSLMSKDEADAIVSELAPIIGRIWRNTIDEHDVAPILRRLTAGGFDILYGYSQSWDNEGNPIDEYMMRLRKAGE